ncbi:MAG TPA: DUF4136 domain-containing protein [Salinisphaeraceae bacterium]|nr:DUF4136 domain-containing protein [Salinisphaeraceae bacterium]
MQRKLMFFLVLAMVALISGCATGLHSEYLRTADFTAYKTFYWLPPITPVMIRNPIIDSDIVTARVRMATVKALSDRGYQQTQDRRNADFIVSYGVSTEQEVRGTTFGDGFGFATYPFYPSIYYPGFYYPFYPSSYTTLEVYEQAHLILNIMDGQTHQLVWRGWNTMRLTADNFSRNSIFEAVQNILTRFPPPESATE